MLVKDIAFESKGMSNPPITQRSCKDRYEHHTQSQDHKLHQIQTVLYLSVVKWKLKFSMKLYVNLFPNFITSHNKVKLTERTTNITAIN